MVNESIANDIVELVEIEEKSVQSLAFWKILIVDEEPKIHRIAQLILEGFTFDNKRLQILSAYFIKDAYQMMTDHPDIAVTLLDVMMESDRAGLEIAKYIRETLQNQAIRIILRTAKPEQLLEQQAVLDYYIDNYKIKTEFTLQKLFTITMAALQSYKIRSTLESVNYELEKHVKERTLELQEEINRRRATEEALTGILNSSLDGIVLLQAVRAWDTGNIKDFRFLMINPQILRALKDKHEDLIGKLVPQDLLTLIEPELFDRLITVVETGQPLEHDFYYPWEGSSWYEFVAVKLDDGLVVTIRDITARKKTELALQDANQQLQALVNLDGLTKVANRRCFNAKLQEEWKRLARERQTISLILFDLDFFKSYNDFYGHLAGDDCLSKVAQAAHNSVMRAGDLVARFGGEEFAIILPNTSLDGAVSVTVRVQEAIRSLAIAHKKPSENSIVTVSLGIASLSPTIEVHSDTLIAKADQALYEAKQQGRDRYCVSNQ